MHIYHNNQLDFTYLSVFNIMYFGNYFLRDTDIAHVQYIFVRPLILLNINENCKASKMSTPIVF